MTLAVSQSDNSQVKIHNSQITIHQSQITIHVLSQPILILTVNFVGWQFIITSLLIRTDTHYLGLLYSIWSFSCQMEEE